MAVVVVVEVTQCCCQWLVSRDFVWHGLEGNEQEQEQEQSPADAQECEKESQEAGQEAIGEKGGNNTVLLLQKALQAVPGTSPRWPATPSSSAKSRTQTGTCSTRCTQQPPCTRQQGPSGAARCTSQTNRESTTLTCCESSVRSKSRVIRLWGTAALFVPHQTD